MNLNLLGALATAFTAAANPSVTADFQALRRKKKKVGRHTQLRNHYVRYSHALTEMVATKNLAAMENGKSTFSGFRKVRIYDETRRMTHWVPAHLVSNHQGEAR